MDFDKEEFEIECRDREGSLIEKFCKTMIGLNRAHKYVSQIINAKEVYEVRSLNERYSECFMKEE